jgi:hypothetical protein
MGEIMTNELKYLALAAAWNAVIWIPDILNMISVRGLKEAVGYPDNPAPILVADAAGIANDATAAPAAVFF